MRKAICLLGLALAACGSPAPRQAPEPGPTPVARPPVYALLGYREQLQLTSAQIAALDSIGSHLESANRPVLDRLAGVRRGVEPPRTQEEYVSLLTQVYANNRAGQDAVRELLSEAQRTRTCELFRATAEEQRRAERRNANRASDPRTRRDRMGTPSDTVAFSSTGVWSWCPALTSTAPTRRR